MIDSGHYSNLFYSFAYFLPMNLERLATLTTNEEKENFVLAYADNLINSKKYTEITPLIVNLKNSWPDLSTARITKIIKTIFDKIHITFDAFQSLITLLNGLITWADDKKMLKLDLECKLINVYLTVGKYEECLEKILKVSKDLKKYDDKINLISLYIYESRAYYELKDLSKAKSSLTSARALAVSSACPANLQAQIDLLNGMYLSDEHAFDTAISYFIESMEGFLQDGSISTAVVALRYIVLNKIMLFKFDDINTLLSSKTTQSIRNDQFVEVLQTISNAVKKRSLNLYNQILLDNMHLVDQDLYIKRHLEYMFGILLDKNIVKIIEPYSHIRISFISQKLQLDEMLIEDKLRKMILDKTISAILDHSTNCLIMLDCEADVRNKAYEDLLLLGNYFN